MRLSKELGVGTIVRTGFILCCFYGIALEAVSASVYKCIDEKGRTAFSDTPCSPSAEKLDGHHASDRREKKSAKPLSKKSVNESSKSTRSGMGEYIDRARNIGR